MANMNSKVKFQLDKDASVTLRAAAAAPITASTSETGLSLNTGTAYWNQGIIPLETAAVNVIVKAIDRTTGDETYTFTVEVSNLIGGTYTEIARISGVTQVGVYSALVDFDTVKKNVPNAAFIRISAALGGTTPILDYDAYLGPVIS